jgi:hypothetical protein
MIDFSRLSENDQDDLARLGFGLTAVMSPREVANMMDLSVQDAVKLVKRGRVLANKRTERA